MLEVVIASEQESTYRSWRMAARRLLQRNVLPAQISWRLRRDAQSDLLTSIDRGTDAQLSDLRSSSATENEAEIVAALANNGKASRVPREFLRLAESVACHSSAERWDFLYRVLYRVTHGEPSLLEVATDPDVHRLIVMDKAIRREVHKMHAFVRFRAVSDECQSQDSIRMSANTQYIAWFEPIHDVVERATPFFARRFASMRWSILTPMQCAHWNGIELQFTPGVTRANAPKDDELEELWRSYYSHIFNPARVATATMQSEMPQRYWVNLPEAQLIAGLKRDAPARVRRMLLQLTEMPADIPEDARSEIGPVSVPNRVAHFSNNSLVDLDVAGEWDTIHDPGVRAARDRNDANASCSRVITLDDIPVRIGTASWTDPTLLRPGVFYPNDATTPEDRLRFYTSQFSVVEVDSTYYVPPTRSMAAAWATRSPDDFVFDVKAYALMTGHAAETKRMPDWLRRALPRSLAGATRVTAKQLPAQVVDDVWHRFQNALGPLKDAGKLGPILLQFPRWFAPSRESADDLRMARERLGGTAAAVEFRNPAWVSGRIAARTMALLEKLDFSYVIVDAPPGTKSSMPPELHVTTPGLSVVRLHGRRTEAWEARHTVVSERYRYLYDREQLTQWTDRIGTVAERMRNMRNGFPDMAKAKQGVHVVFNNCHANYGTSNATEITSLLIEFDRIRRRLI